MKKTVFIVLLSLIGSVVLAQKTYRDSFGNVIATLSSNGNLYNNVGVHIGQIRVQNDVATLTNRLGEVVITVSLSEEEKLQKTLDKQIQQLNTKIGNSLNGMSSYSTSQPLPTYYTPSSLQNIPPPRPKYNVQRPSFQPVQSSDLGLGAVINALQNHVYTESDFTTNSNVIIGGSFLDNEFERTISYWEKKHAEEEIKKQKDEAQKQKELLEIEEKKKEIYYILHPIQPYNNNNSISFSKKKNPDIQFEDKLINTSEKTKKYRYKNLNRVGILSLTSKVWDTYDFEKANIITELIKGKKVRVTGKFNSKNHSTYEVILENGKKGYLSIHSITLK